MLRLFRVYCFYEKEKEKGKNGNKKKKKKEKPVCFTFVGTAVDCSCQGNKQ